MSRLRPAKSTNPREDDGARVVAPARTPKVAIGPFDKTRAITPSSVGHAGQRRARNASRAAKGTPAAVPDSAARANALDAIPRAAVPRAVWRDPPSRATGMSSRQQPK